MSELIITQFSGEFRVDSRTMAERLDNKHKSVMQLIAKNDALFAGFGQLPFEMEVGHRTQGGGNPQRYALLNEDQCYFLLTLVRNSKKVTELKAKLIHAFRQAREARPAFPIPQTFSEALMVAAQIEQERERLALKVQADAPKVEAFDTFMDSSALLTIQRAGQLLNIGEHKLFKYLREERVLMDGDIAGQELHNTPYRRYLELGYFEVKSGAHTLNSGRVIATHTTYVTPRGMDFLRRLTGKKPSNLPLPLLTAAVPA